MRQSANEKSRTVVTGQNFSRRWRRFRRRAFVAGVPRIWRQRLPIRFAALWIVIAGAAGLVIYYGSVLLKAANQPGLLTDQQLTATQSMIAVGAAALTLVLAVWRSLTAKRQTDIANRQADTAARQAEAAEYGRRTDRYTTGVRMLGDELMMIRMGGLDLLAQLARDDSQRFGRAVCDTLAAFVRHPPHNKAGQRVIRVWSGDTEIGPDNAEDDDSPEDLEYRLRPDVNEAVIRLGLLAEDARRRYGVPESYQPNLAEADLRGLKAFSACLTRLNFTKARLTNALLVGVAAEHVQFWGADLRGADLSEANLRSAAVVTGRTAGIRLDGANLEQANIEISGALRSAFDAHVSGTIISIEPGTEPDIDGLWAWRDDPPTFVGRAADTKIARMKILLYDEKLRPSWPNPGPLMWGSDFGPPEKAKPLDADEES